MSERYGVRPKGEVVESPVDERFGQPFAWGTAAGQVLACPRCGGVSEADQAEIHTRELAAELAEFDHYKPQHTREEAAQ